MTVVHHREAVFGEPLTIETWVSTFKRGLVSHREVRVTVDGEPLVSATQEWVHVQTQPTLSPSRAAPELVDALSPIEHGAGHVVLPPMESSEGPELRAVELQLWHTWMDPLAHANHPAYVDWCDEAVCRRLASRGHDPQGLVPVAEYVHYRSGAMAPETVSVHSRVVGRTGDSLALTHRLVGADGRLCATATTLRRHLDGIEVLAASHQALG